MHEALFFQDEPPRDSQTGSDFPRVGVAVDVEILIELWVGQAFLNHMTSKI